MRRIFIFLFIAAALLIRIQAEIFIGGQNEFTINTMINTGSIPGSIISGRDNFQLNIDAEADNFTLSIQSVLDYSIEDNQLELCFNKIMAKIEPLDFLTIRAGKFRYSPGTAELLSNTDYFIGSDLEKVITGSLEKASLDNYLLQTGFFVDNFYINITAAPFHLEPVMPEFSSPWFPQKDLPGEITINFPVEQTLTLEHLFINKPETAANTLGNTALSVETGYAFSFIDISMLYYYGDDNGFLYKAAIDFPQGLFENYDIYITPLVKPISAIGMNINALFSPFRFWLDASYSSGKSFMTEALAFDNFETIAVLADYLAYTIGASLDIQSLNLILMTEYKNSHIFSSHPGIMVPFMSSLLSVMALSRLWDSRIQIQGLYLFSPVDRSMCAGGSISFIPSSDIEFNLTAPFFIGVKDSVFGQYKNNHLVSVGLVLKF